MKSIRPDAFSTAWNCTVVVVLYRVPLHWNVTVVAASWRQTRTFWRSSQYGATTPVGCAAAGITPLAKPPELQVGVTVPNVRKPLAAMTTSPGAVAPKYGNAKPPGSACAT